MVCEGRGTCRSCNGKRTITCATCRGAGAMAKVAAPESGELRLTVSERFVPPTPGAASLPWGGAKLVCHERGTRLVPRRPSPGGAYRGEEPRVSVEVDAEIDALLDAAGEAVEQELRVELLDRRPG